VDGSGNAIPNLTCATLLKPARQSGVNINLCFYLIKSVKYILRYSNPTGVIEAGVVVTFANYDLTTSSKLQQSFQVLFIPSSVTLVTHSFNDLILIFNRNENQGSVIEKLKTEFMAKLLNNN
jgi:hypothetical protein